VRGYTAFANTRAGAAWMALVAEMNFRMLYQP
jgi:hypothetical protein